MAEYELSELTERRLLAVQASLEADELGPFLSRAYELVARPAAALTLQPVSPPLVRYLDPKGPVFILQAGFFFPRSAEGEGDVAASTLPAGRVTAELMGPYPRLRELYAGSAEWAAREGLALSGESIEEYLAFPSEAGEPRTRVYWLVISR